MDNPSELLNKKDNSFVSESHLAGLALELADNLQLTDYDIAKQLSELSKSYRSLRVSALQSYLVLFSLYNSQLKKGEEEVYKLHVLLNNLVFSQIVQSKSSLDLMVCVIDCIVNKDLREEYQLTDFEKYLKSSTPVEIKSKLENIKSEDWFEELSLTRNRIIHRGFEIDFDLKSNRTVNDDTKKTKMTFFIYKLSTIKEEENELIESDGFTKDHLGRIKKDINLERILIGINKLEIVEKEICNQLIELGFTNSLSEFEAVITNFGGSGQLVSHKSFFEVRKNQQ